MAISNEIRNFAQNNTKFYERVEDFAIHYMAEVNQKNVGIYDNSISFSEKTARLNDAFIDEVVRMSGVACPEGMDASYWASNSQVKWAAFSIINAAVNVIMPITGNKSIAPFADTQNVGQGDSLMVKVNPGYLYTLTHSSKGERETFRQKKYTRELMITPVGHMITTYTDYFRVMCKKEDIGPVLVQIAASMEIAMNKDAYEALKAGFNTTAASGWSQPYGGDMVYSGALAADTLVNMCQTVEAYNNGAKPIIMGTARAMMKIQDKMGSSFHGNFDVAGGQFGFVSDFFGYQTNILPQMPNLGAGFKPISGGNNNKLYLDDNYLWVVSPSMNKLVHGAVSTGLNNNNDFLQHADLTANMTMRKDWAFEFVGGQYAGLYKITS